MDGMPAGARTNGDGPAPGSGVSRQLWDDDRGEVARNLLSSGVRCFAASGFHATTTRDITSAVGLSPGALYVHFRSKEHVLFEIIRTGHRRSLDVLGDDPADDASEHLRSLVRRFVAWHAHHHVVARVCQYELAALSPAHYEEIRELRRRSTATFQDAVTRGVAERSFADVDVHRVVRAILSLGVDLVRWYRSDGPDSPEQLGEFYADLALGMVTGARSSRSCPSVGGGGST
ncbi:DNA-binding transcriptional regulator, AcrR family [Prauserella marina]|uniref:DNA-binding transcriptional regulator, AcrR family n=2 Tax=Prauserella marina TaxID=530584 RepID=A0A1G6LF32_9PSEU|nr:TetR/AcrR family transcriptional regulator [Prauserella marina]PWV85942.1 TetR family transcriptional regulator [Prauserella marina]SDC41783.1 DNA-binding transcriptional regulator, AcrR family [Prauserella marina]